MSEEDLQEMIGPVTRLEALAYRATAALIRREGITLEPVDMPCLDHDFAVRFLRQMGERVALELDLRADRILRDG